MGCGRAVALRASALFRGHPAAAGARPLPARRLRPRPAPRAASPPVRGSWWFGPSGRLRRFPPGPSVALCPFGASAGSAPLSAPCSRLALSARLPPGLLGRCSSGPGGRSPRGGRWPGWLRWPGWRSLFGFAARGPAPGLLLSSRSRRFVAVWGRGPDAIPPGAIVQWPPGGMVGPYPPACVAASRLGRVDAAQAAPLDNPKYVKSAGFHRL